MSILDKIRGAVGPCPVCGRTDVWLNDVPLKAFCWGTEAMPHPEASRTVPSPQQPYSLVEESSWHIAEQESA